MTVKMRSSHIGYVSHPLFLHSENDLEHNALWVKAIVIRPPEKCDSTQLNVDSIIGDIPNRSHTN